jgi:hypothetical protein
MAAFEAALEDSAILQFVYHIRTRYPDYFNGFTEAGICEFVSKALSTAKEFGVNRTLDLVVFLEFSVLYGPDFHKQPWAARILNRPGMDAFDRMSALRFVVLASLGEV